MDGKEFGAGIELLQIVRQQEEGTKAKVIIKEENGISKEEKIKEEEIKIEKI